MTKPTILTVDDDPAVSQAITRDLRRRYGADYRVVVATSGAEALALLAELALRGRPVALIVTDQRMPEMTGIELLEQSRRRRPTPSSLLLTAYADTDVAIRAINDIGLDYYLLKPWDPPDERLYPVVDDLLDDWRQEHPEDTADVRVVGHRWSERSHEIKTFLARNHVPYRWLDVERDDEAAAAAGRLAGGRRDDLPLVLVPDGEPLRVADHAGPRRRARPAHPRRAAALRPVHRRWRAGRAGRSRLRRLRRAAAPSSSSARRRAARPARAPRSRTTSASRRGCRAPTSPIARWPRPRRFGAEMVLARDVVGFETRGPVRAVRFGDGGEIEARARARGDRGVLPPARGARAGRPHRPRRLLRRQRERGDPVPGRRGLRRRRRQLRRAGGAEPGPLRQARRAARPRSAPRGQHVAATSSTGSRPPPNIEVRLRHRGRRRPAATATSRR